MRAAGDDGPPRDARAAAVAARWPVSVWRGAAAGRTAPNCCVEPGRAPAGARGIVASAALAGGVTAGALGRGATAVWTDVACAENSAPQSGQDGSGSSSRRSSSKVAKSFETSIVSAKKARPLSR